MHVKANRPTAFEFIKIVPMDLFAEPREPITASTIPKCGHGVYDPSRTGRAYHCSLCRCPNYALPTNGFSLPVDSSIALNFNDKKHANKNYDPGCCQQCGSRIHVGEDEWRCAECGKPMVTPRKKKQVLEEVLA